MARKISLRVELLEVRALLSSLAYTLTTDQPTYQAGQPVVLTLKVTNDTSAPATFSEGPSNDGFTVTENGQTIWTSNSGVTSQELTTVTLQPGGVWSEPPVTWNGMEAAGSSVAATGSFTVTNQLAPRVRAHRSR